MLEKYIVKANISLDSQLFLFRPIVASKPARLIDSGKLTYTRLREIVVSVQIYDFIEIPPC